MRVNLLSDRGKINGPVGVVVMLLVIVLILIAEPILGWIMLPALLIGMLVAIILRRSGNPPFFDEKAQGSAEIRIDRIPVSGDLLVRYLLSARWLSSLLHLMKSDGFSCFLFHAVFSQDCSSTFG